MPDTLGMEANRFLQGVIALADTNAFTFDARALKNITVITDAGCTATVSRVDTANANAHTAGATNQFTVAPTTRTVTPLDWPFYRVSAAGGTCRVALT